MKYETHTTPIATCLSSPGPLPPPYPTKNPHPKVIHYTIMWILTPPGPLNVGGQGIAEIHMAHASETDCILI